MSTRADPSGVVAELVASVADGRLGDPRTPSEAARRLMEATASSGSALYVVDATSGSFHRRDHIGSGVGPHGGAPPSELSPADYPEICGALQAGVAIEPGVGPREERRAVLADGAVLVPLRAGGETVGALALSDPTPQDRDLISVGAKVLALLVRNGQLFSGLQERARELDRQLRQLTALSEVARAVSVPIDDRDVPLTVARQARRLVLAEGAAVLARGASGRLEVIAVDGRVLEHAEGAAEAALASNTAQMLPGPTIALPLAHPADAALIVRRSGTPFADDDVERLQGLAEQAGIALANAQLLSDLQFEQGRRQRVAAALVQAQEQERRRVAEDLHDGPVQELAGLGLLLDALAEDLRRLGSDAAQPAAEAARSSRAAVTGLRQAIFDLHPMSLEELGFAAATRTVMQRLTWRGLDTTLEGLDSADLLSPTHRTVAFRIVQEALANVARHAGAGRVEVTAGRDGDGIWVEVRDDGMGFDPREVGGRIDKGHLGLAAMRERAELAGGALRISSSPGRGARVRARFPMPSVFGDNPVEGGPQGVVVGET